MRRVSVVGTSGSGKTTLARVLARRLSVPYIELDAIFWGPNWTPPSDEDFRDRARDVVAADAWVCDGNYSAVRDVVQPRADTLVWLDLPFPVVLARTVRRSVGRAISREEFWSGNVEDWRRVVGRDSLIWWVASTHRSRRKHWEAWLQQPEAAHLRVVRLRSRRAVRSWLASVPQAADAD
jgi:adenylate kinase family enzyme